MKTQPKKCETCRQEIKWITLKGKPHPLNTQMLYVSPNGSGKRLMLFQSDGASAQGFLCKPGDPGAQGGYQSHFATCKQAHEWRGNPHSKHVTIDGTPIRVKPKDKAQPVEEQAAFDFER